MNVKHLNTSSLSMGWSKIVMVYRKNITLQISKHESC